MVKRLRGTVKLCPLLKIDAECLVCWTFSKMNWNTVENGIGYCWNMDPNLTPHISEEYIWMSDGVGNITS